MSLSTKNLAAAPIATIHSKATVNGTRQTFCLQCSLDLGEVVPWPCFEVRALTKLGTPTG